MEVVYVYQPGVCHILALDDDTILKISVATYDNIRMGIVEDIFNALQYIVRGVHIIIVKSAKESDVLNLGKDIVVDFIPGLGDIPEGKIQDNRIQLVKDIRDFVLPIIR